MNVPSNAASTLSLSLALSSSDISRGTLPRWICLLISGPKIYSAPRWRNTRTDSTSTLLRHDKLVVLSSTDRFCPCAVTASLASSAPSCYSGRGVPCHRILFRSNPEITRPLSSCCRWCIGVPTDDAQSNRTSSATDSVGA